MKYQSELKPYGLNDARLSNSVEVLSNIYTKRLLKTNTTMILGILKRVRILFVILLIESLHYRNVMRSLKSIKKMKR